MSLKKRFFLFFTTVFLGILLSSCSSTKGIASNEETAKAQQDTEPTEKSHTQAQESSLSLIFAGDIMAHKPNYTAGNFTGIWRDITPLISSCDLAFANVEAPVANSLPWSTYPQFNMHTEYVEAAINAGFNVFSLANNHTNDQSLQGIKETKKYFDSRPHIWACGVKDTADGPLTYKIIEKNGWKVLFVAITEILNSFDASSYIDYYPSTEKKRAQLIDELKTVQEQAHCDLFIVSVHTDEPEYIIKVTENHKAFFRKIIAECKADIIWENHPHVVKYFETVEPADSRTTAQNGRTAFIMYANGNTISAQRTNPQFSAPETQRDYTGDGLIVKLKAIKKSDGSVTLTDYEPHLITTYITPSSQYVIKFLEEDFISALDRAEVKNWANYLSKRKKLVETILERK